MKKALKPCLKLEIASEISAELPTSIGRACRIIGLSRSVYYYQSTKKGSELIQALEEQTQAHPDEGFWNAYDRFRLTGKLWNHKIKITINLYHMRH